LLFIDNQKRSVTPGTPLPYLAHEETDGTSTQCDLLTFVEKAVRNLESGKQSAVTHQAPGLLTPLRELLIHRVIA
jgi:hypothetical protein